MLSPTFNTFFNLCFTISVNGIIIHIVAPVKPWEPSVAFFPLSHLREHLLNLYIHLLKNELRFLFLAFIATYLQPSHSI